MGSVNQATEQQKSFYQKLIYVRSIDNSKYLMKDPNSSQLYAVVEHPFPTQQQMSIFSQQLNKKKMLTHQYYMSPINHILQSTSNLCSKQFKAIQIFKWEEYTLMDEINSRKQQNKGFSDREVWSILCSCVLVMSHLTKNDLVHLTLSPRDIVLTQCGQVKVLPSQLSPYSFDYTYKHGFFYSPELLKSICTHSLYNASNKSSVWTLALTILSIIYVKDMTYLYKDGEKIDYGEVKKLIEGVRNEDIRNVISKMLKNAAYERISFTQLQQMLYEILQDASVLQDNSNSGYELQEAEHHQIQRLQQSIYRLKTKQQPSIQSFQKQTKNERVKNSKICMKVSSSIQMDEDLQDTLSNQSVQQLCIDKRIDNQIMDQVDNQKIKQQSKANQNILIQNIDINNTNNIQANGKDLIKNKLKKSHNKQSQNSNITNTIQISESLKIVDNSQNNQNSLNSKSYQYYNYNRTSRQIGPYYVTEQYSRGKYEGYKENGMRHGFGTFYYEEGGKYSGQWNKNKMEGRGALYYINNQLAYQGQWRQDQLHGYGVLYNQTPIYITDSIDWKNIDKVTACWVKYQGNFIKDMKQGQGTLYISNGEYFRGEFKGDFPHGNGVFRTLNNSLIKGVWRDGVFLRFQQ